MYSINGKFLVRSMNGQIRVAVETIKELDKLVPDGFCEIVAPESDKSLDDLNHIPIKRIGKGNPYLWEQLTYCLYLKKNGFIGVNILNSHPILKPDIAYIHDTFFSAFPSVYTSRYGRLQKKFSLLMEKTAAKKAKKIITVSNFSKSEIMKFHNVSCNKIEVIYNGWQHMTRIIEDEEVFTKHPIIKKNKYIMAASGITPQKNFNWIIENAKYNKEYMYVIVGPREKSTQDDTNSYGNIYYTGRVSDGELKALMHYCLAFIHPAIYEGFGMTPLEAAGCGCKNLIVSNAACLPEIYGEHARYINPNEAEIEIDSILQTEDSAIAELLDKYSWKKSAELLYEVLNNL